MEPSALFDLGYAALLLLGFTAAWKAWQTRKPRVLLPLPGPGPGPRMRASRDRLPR